MRVLRDKTGAVAVEFAVLVPLLLILIFGAFAYGSVMYQQMLLEDAVRTAANFANLNGHDPAGIAQILDKAQPLISAPPSVTFGEYCVCANNIALTGSTLTIGNLTVTGCPAPGGTDPCLVQDPSDPRVLHYLVIKANEPSWLAGVVPPASLNATAVVRVD